MNYAPKLTTYRLDDLPLVLGLLMQLNLPKIFDSVIEDHGLHTGLSGGWMKTIWLAFIITRGDHTKYKLDFCGNKRALDTQNLRCVDDDHALIEGYEAQAIFIG